MHDHKTEPSRTAAGGRLLGMSVLFAVAILLSAWLRSIGSAPGISVLVIVVAGLLGGWLLHEHARVRGMPFAAATIMTAVTVVGWVAGWQAGGVPPGSTFFIALLLSASARSWTVGIVTTSILAGAELLARVI